MSLASSASALQCHDSPPQQPSVSYTLQASQRTYDEFSGAEPWLTCEESFIACEPLII